MNNVVLLDSPELHSPRLVAAFGGWPDAAEAGTRSVRYLIRSLAAVKFAEIAPEEFFNFADCRPMVTVEDGALRQLRLPTNDFYYWKNPEGQDLILFRGTEPQLKWRTFADTVVKLALQFQVERVIALGGIYDSVPHTRETRITGLVNMMGLKALLRANGVAAVNYRGPGAFHSMMLSACSGAHLEMVTLWGHAPFYVRSEANPRVCRDLLTVLSNILGVVVDVGELDKAGARMDSMLDRLMTENQALRSHVLRLEEMHDAATVVPWPPEGTEQLVRDVEEFLRREGGKGRNPEAA